MRGYIVNPHQAYCTQRRMPRAMAQARFRRNWETIARLANRHTLSVQSWLSSRSPQAARLDGIGVTATSTGLPVPFLNLALGSQFPPGTQERVIEEEVQAVKAFFARRGVPFMWLLSPFASPPNMGKRLKEHGLSQAQYRLPLMVAPLNSPPTYPAPPSQVYSWQAQSRADLQAASTIRRIAFRFKPGTALTYFEDMAEDWLLGDPARLFLAHAEEGAPPAAIGACIMAAGVPGIYVMATLPAWGRRGLGKAVLARILSEAKEEGHALIVLTASAQGYPLYRKFGFEHIFEYEVYRMP